MRFIARRLAAQADVFVPVGPLALEVLGWADLRRPPGGGGAGAKGKGGLATSGAGCPDLTLQLKVGGGRMGIAAVRTGFEPFVEGGVQRARAGWPPAQPAAPTSRCSSRWVGGGWALRLWGRVLWACRVRVVPRAGAGCPDLTLQLKGVGLMGIEAVGRGFGAGKGEGPRARAGWPPARRAAPTSPCSSRCVRRVFGYH